VKNVKRIVLVLISLIVIVYGIGFMLVNGVTGTLLNEEYYQTVMAENDIPQVAHDTLQEVIPPIVNDGITDGATITDPAKKAVVDSQVDLFSSAIIDALDTQWIEEQITIVTDDLIESLTGEAGTLTAVIDLQPKIDEIESNIAEALQQYSDAELMAMFGAPKAYIPTIAEQIVQQLGLPESLILNDLVGEMAPGTIDMARGYLATANVVFGMIMLIVVLVVFLLLCVLLATRNIGIIWFGASLFISGMLYRIGTSRLTSFFSVENIIESATESLPISSELLSHIFQYTISEIAGLSTIFMIVGGVFVLGGILLVRQKQK